MKQFNKFSRTLWDDAAKSILSGEHGYTEFMMLEYWLREEAGKPDAPLMLKAAAEVLSNLRRMMEWSSIL